MPDVIATASRVTAHAAASVEAGAPRTEIISHACAGRRLPSKVLSKPPLRGFRTVCALAVMACAWACVGRGGRFRCVPLRVSASPLIPFVAFVRQSCSEMPVECLDTLIMYALTVRLCDFVDRMCWSCVCLGVRGKENCLHVMRKLSNTTPGHDTTSSLNTCVLTEGCGAVL